MGKLKKISVTGGKGGVGKSTVAILLANKLLAKGKKVVLLDLDVECPNDYLLLSQKLTTPVKKIWAQFPKLNKAKCTKCGLCARNCRSQAIFMPPGGYPLFVSELCSGCGLCWHLCPEKAIEVEKKIIGEVFENKVSSNFHLITGRVVGVVDESGPIVTKAKEHGLKIAKRLKADYFLVDTAVGLHCGVIRALLGSDLSLAVTEPTPLGAHDLRLILDLLKKLKIKAKIILNQADLGDKKEILKISKERKIKLEKEIPYSKALAQAYSKGKLKEVNFW